MARHLAPNPNPNPTLTLTLTLSLTLTLTRHDTSLAVLSSLDGNMQSYKVQCDDARASQTALTKKVALTAAP